MKRHLASLACFVLATLAFEVGAQDAPETISVTSSAFDHHGMVPEANSAYGDNVSIDLSWADLPEGTQQLALICDDPSCRDRHDGAAIRALGDVQHPRFGLRAARRVTE